MAEAEELQKQLDEEKEQSSKLRDEVSDKTTLLECLFQEAAELQREARKAKVQGSLELLLTD